MAIMCEQRVTLPPISSLDFPCSTPRDTRPWYGREGSPREPDSSSRPPSAHYQRSSRDAQSPPLSGEPFPTLALRQGDRHRLTAYDTPGHPDLPPLPSNPRRRLSPHSLDDRRPHSSHATNVADSLHLRVSHVRNTSQLSAASADSWSQYDSEHPDSPNLRTRSLSPGGTVRMSGPPSTEPVTHFIYATLGESSAPRKRKAEEASSGSEDGVSHEQDEKGAPREPADGKRKYKKMMNVRHYRAQTKDALQSLRDVLPESIRPPERQARSFTVVNAVKHIENLTSQLEQLQTENRLQAAQLELAGKRELALSTKVVELERALADKESKGNSISHEQAPVAKHEGDRA